MATWAVSYRPHLFSEVIGQEHVTVLLKAMSSRLYDEGRRWPPALVFYGPRGTGKTTMARIVSASLNCHNPQKGEPCLECSSCVSIRNGTSPGVSELDMASNGSVEDVREIRNRASFSMSSEAYRVYLLDEVHSASKEAFNALLKILEEPPPGLLFVLITTEPERIPDTIRSRAMEFEFRRLSPQHLIDRLRQVAEAEGVLDRIDDAVFPLLASRARGGMRDAVMSLEQVCFNEGRVTPTTVRETFGVSDLPERLLDAAVKGDVSRGFAILQEAVLAAVPVPVLITEMLDGLTALLASAQGSPVAPQGSISPEWVSAYAGSIPASAVVAGIGVLWAMQGRTRAADASAGSTLAAGYALFVEAVSPGSYGAASSVSLPSNQPSVNPSPTSQPMSDQASSVPLSPDALGALLSSLQASPSEDSA